MQESKKPSRAPRAELTAASLRARREAAGVTQQQVAEAVGTSLQNIKNYEKGLYRPSEKVQETIEKFEEPAGALARAAKAYETTTDIFNGLIRLPYFRTRADVEDYALSLVANPRLATATASLKTNPVGSLLDMSVNQMNRMFSRAFDEFSAKHVEVIWYYVGDLEDLTAEELICADPFLAERWNPLLSETPFRPVDPVDDPWFDEAYGKHELPYDVWQYRLQAPSLYFHIKKDSDLFGFNFPEDFCLYTIPEELPYEWAITDIGRRYMETEHYRKYARPDSTGDPV